MSDQALLQRGCVSILPQEVWQAKLDSGKPLTIKAGFDATAPNLHFGHVVLLNKLRQFQDCGHRVMMIAGDFTSQIGDPSGKNVTRPILSKDEVKANVETYRQQATKVLDPSQLTFRYNSEWWDTMPVMDLIGLIAQQTVARMLEREDFAQRYQSHQSIGIHEFIYPVLQGYDSVMVHADVECGGTDQTFNLLMGREYQKLNGQTPQVVMTLPLLEGLDGVKKMSKSLDNAIGLNDDPTDMFGKIMSISDEMMWRYYVLLTSHDSQAIDRLKSQVEQGKNPKDIKIQLATELVTRFHDAQAAKRAAIDFNQRFVQQTVPDDIASTALTSADPMPIANILKQTGLVPSTSQGLRMIKQGAVKIDGVKIQDNVIIGIDGKARVLQVGKRRMAKITLIHG